MGVPAMTASLSDRFRGPLAAASAVAGIIAGILGAWLTGHWQWGIFCFLLVLIAFVAAAEAYKAARETKESGALAVNSPAHSGSYVAFNYTDDHSNRGNVSTGIQIAGGNIKTRQSIKNSSRTTTIKLGGLWLVALLALGGAVGGTFAKLPNSGSPQAPSVLAAEGGHGSPQAAVKGFIGNALQNNWAGACNYEIPSGQSACSSDAPAQQSGYLAVGDGIISGQQALVPVSGTVCKYGDCETVSGNGIPAGTSFQAAYLQATNLVNQVPNLVACEEVGGKWYVEIPFIPGF
jgi:MFS family permease